MTSSWVAVAAAQAGLSSRRRSRRNQTMPGRWPSEVTEPVWVARLADLDSLPRSDAALERWASVRCRAAGHCEPVDSAVGNIRDDRAARVRETRRTSSKGSLCLLHHTSPAASVTHRAS